MTILCNSLPHVITLLLLYSMNKPASPNFVTVCPSLFLRFLCPLSLDTACICVRAIMNTKVCVDEAEKNESGSIMW